MVQQEMLHMQAVVQTSRQQMDAAQQTVTVQPTTEFFSLLIHRRDTDEATIVLWSRRWEEYICPDDTSVLWSVGRKDCARRWKQKHLLLEAYSKPQCRPTRNTDLQYISTSSSYWWMHELSWLPKTANLEPVPHRGENSWTRTSQRWVRGTASLLDQNPDSVIRHQRLIEQPREVGIPGQTTWCDCLRAGECASARQSLSWVVCIMCALQTSTKKWSCMTLLPLRLISVAAFTRCLRRTASVETAQEAVETTEFLHPWRL